MSRAKRLPANALPPATDPPFQLRGFLPTTPATNGVAAGLTEEHDRRAKRAKRFDQAQGGTAAPNPNAAANMMGRLVQGGVHSFGDVSARSTPDSDALYDPVSFCACSELSSEAFTESACGWELTKVASAPRSQNVIDWDQYTIVGRSTKLEKPYLRLTSVSVPHFRRPRSGTSD